jgi:hypothetical protein
MNLTAQRERTVQFAGYNQDRNRKAKVAELADAPDLGSGSARSGGSSPPFRTRILVCKMMERLVLPFSLRTFRVCVARVSQVVVHLLHHFGDSVLPFLRP